MEELLGKQLAKLELPFFEQLSREAFADDTLYLLFEAAAEHERNGLKGSSLRFLFVNDGKAFMRSDGRNSIHIYESGRLDLARGESQYILLLGEEEQDSLSKEAEALFARLQNVLRRKRVQYRTLECEAVPSAKHGVRVLRAASLRIGAAAML
ncbi:hypothetical protein [Saccharibacillus alkalitolerans]|uniref:Uncharacterized protein n=1 Tax=Saccharibacillus alkalitolerans TaxID=2705290 RepID=A0ABX0F5K2_9BACL|nr:hypothetical protein [Saccharibacillus alkalitolerans]NGZ75294.1 hypothetical protein [Saccharibacillus alkalitolerans]